MPLGRILPHPSGTMSAQPACVARTRPSLARLGLRSVRGPWPGPARPSAARVPRGDDVTGAREAVRGRARRGLTGA
jgi:hypothetical protein